MNAFIYWLWKWQRSRAAKKQQSIPSTTSSTPTKPPPPPPTKPPVQPPPLPPSQSRAQPPPLPKPPTQPPRLPGPLTKEQNLAVSPEVYFDREEVWTKVVSSNVHAIAYYTAPIAHGAGTMESILGVKFGGMRGRPIVMYWYFNVERSVYTDMMVSSSKGKFVWRELRGHYRYRKIT